jgi:2-C-methyl-D-erythritol 2,4-cyclodiphosphate synthase
LRVGLGYDLHRLVAGRPFIIGGITIETEFGPEGHSDGDALTHAITDALLGAAGLPDIGVWFPPDDTEFKNANSLKLLEKIVGEIDKNGYQIGNIDSVLICEKPKLSPHYAAIRKSLATVMEIGENQISIKSKTNEKLGEIGKGEAIAAQAIALLFPKI